MSNSVNPAISRVGVVSGPAKFDALAQPENKAGEAAAGKNKITIGGVLKEKNGDTSSSNDNGERAVGEDTTDKGKTSLVSESMQDKVIKDATSQASQSRLEKLMENAENFQPQTPPGPDPSMMGQNQGMDPAMMAALMGKGQQGSGQGGTQKSSGQSPQKSQGSSGSEQAKEQMQKMSDKFTDALKERDAKIKELAEKVKENKNPRNAREKQDSIDHRDSKQGKDVSNETERGGLGSDINQLAKYESLIETMSSNTASTEDKAKAKQEMLAMTNQNLVNQISPESKNKIKNEFGDTGTLNAAIKEAKQESQRSEDTIAEYDSESFSVSDLIKRDSDIYASSRVEDNNELDINFEDEEIEIPDLDLDIDIDID
jgi:hypothetical protein